MNASAVPSRPASGMTTWIRQPLDRRITCALGTLWLRFDGDAEGFVLQAGQSHHCRSARPLAIRASVSAALMVA